MRTVVVRDLWLRTLHGRTLVAGGWQVVVPEVEPCAGDLRSLVSAVLDDHAGDAREAERRVRADVAREYAQARVRNVRLSVAYFARKYARAHPERVKKCDGYVTLKGFDAARAASVYWPALNTGRAGNPWTRRLIAEMGAN